MFLVTSGWCWNIFMWQMAYVRESVKLASGLPSSIRGSARFPSIKPRTCFSLSWHLWIRSVFLSLDPLRNVSIKLSASFNPVFKMLSLSMKFLHVPGVTGEMSPSKESEVVEAAQQHSEPYTQDRNTDKITNFVVSCAENRRWCANIPALYLRCPGLWPCHWL